MTILVVNAGSTSTKLSVIDGDDALVAERQLGPPDSQFGTDLEKFLDQLTTPIDVVGHRVVHGGTRYRQPVVLDAAHRAALDGLTDLAPLHNPPSLAGIDAATALLPDVPAVACFDTAFHADLPPEASTYALPAAWVTRWGIRRFGFHGLSCAWATRRAGEVLSWPPQDLKLVICHLGGGASVTAVAGGRSVDTTMGFTPLEGLVMATRSGDVDPGALVWLLHHGLSVDQLDHGLEHDAGLLGLSGSAASSPSPASSSPASGSGSARSSPASSDIRQVLEARARGDQPAAVAIGVYVHRLRAKIATMVAATEGLDVLVFTGGVGEHSADIRAETIAGLGWLGLAIDPAANDAPSIGDTDISAQATGGPRTLVIQAREDLQIAAECRHLLGP